MHSILSVVTSLNGLTTRGKEGPFSWASPEDQKKFADIKARSDVVAMGPNTYRGARDAIFANLTEKPMRAIISRGEDFRLDTVPNKLEFFTSIEEFLKQIAKV
jgi:dihydrofolate reductase